MLYMYFKKNCCATPSKAEYHIQFNAYKMATLRELDSGCLKGAGHLIEVKTIKKALIDTLTTSYLIGVAI